MQEKTIFEKLIAGEIPCNKLYEDDKTFAFLDISPNTRGHALVVPKYPYRNVFDMPEEEIAHLYQSVKKVALAFKDILKADGVNIVSNNEEVAGQIVFHAHVHVVPRYVNDSGWYGKKYKYKEGEAEEISKQIRSYLINN